MPKLLNFKGGEKSFENLAEALSDSNLIVLTCLGSSDGAATCYEVLKKTIGDEDGTVLTHVEDDADADTVRGELRQLGGGGAVTDTCICVVVDHLEQVVCVVEDPDLTMDAVLAWAEAVKQRGA